MSAGVQTPGYWRLLWVLYCKECFRLKRNPAALMAAGLIVLMAFLVSLENKAIQTAQRQEKLPCAVVFNTDSELMNALKASKQGKKIRFFRVDSTRMQQGLHYAPSMRCLAEVMESESQEGKHEITITYKAVDANNSQMTQFNRWLLTEIANLNQDIRLTQRLVGIKESTKAPPTLAKIDLGSNDAKSMIGAMLIFSAQYFLSMALFISFTGHERERGILQALALTTTTPGQMLFAKLLFHTSLSFIVSVLIFKMMTGATWMLMGLLTFPVLLPIFVCSSIGFFSIAAIIVSVYRNQTTASLVGFSYLMLMGVIFSLAGKFSAFALLKSWMFESHAIALFQMWMGSNKFSGDSVVIQMLTLFLLSVLLWTVAYAVFRRRGWRA